MAPNGRILFFWNPHVQVLLLYIAKQFLHYKVKTIDFTTLLIIYCLCNNEAQVKRTLWSDLVQLGRKNQEPWLLSGDFNVVLRSEDRIVSCVT